MDPKGSVQKPFALIKSHDVVLNFFNPKLLKLVPIFVLTFAPLGPYKPTSFCPKSLGADLHELNLFNFALSL